MTIGPVQAKFDRHSLETTDDYQQLKREAADDKLCYLRDVHSAEEFDKPPEAPHYLPHHHLLINFSQIVLQARGDGRMKREDEMKVNSYKDGLGNGGGKILRESKAQGRVGSVAGLFPSNASWPASSINHSQSISLSVPVGET
jgi:hypothetical protein